MRLVFLLLLGLSFSTMAQSKEYDIVSKPISQNDALYEGKDGHLYFIYHDDDGTQHKTDKVFAVVRKPEDELKKLNKKYSELEMQLQDTMEQIRKLEAKIGIDKGQKNLPKKDNKPQQDNRLPPGETWESQGSNSHYDIWTGGYSN